MIKTTYDPATHVLVPRELTNEMMMEGQIGYVRWNALIAAAPAAPAQPVPDSTAAQPKEPNHAS